MVIASLHCPDSPAAQVLAAATAAGSAYAAQPTGSRGRLDFFALMATCPHPWPAAVVLLACGMDTRAFRLPWPVGTRVFEVDFPDVLAFRDFALAAHDLAPTCVRVSVGADLREDWTAALIAADFDPTHPTAWLLEGILYALSQEGAGHVMQARSGLSAQRSVVALDHIEDSELLREARRLLAPELVDLWQGGPRGDLAAWLEQFGWRPDVRDLREIATIYERDVPEELTAGGSASRAWLATASKR